MPLTRPLIRPLIRVDADGPTPRLHASTQALWPILRRVSDGPGPVIVMIHGYKYQPGHRQACPHRHILSLTPEALPWRPLSWPGELGFGRDIGNSTNGGLAIAFGWNARGALWQARRRAETAGLALARVLARLHRHAPNRPIHILAHSMGVEVALEALHHLPAGTVGRILSLTGACYRSRVRTALTTDAGAAAEFINVTTRENDLFDFLYERLIPPPDKRDRALGAGLDAANALTLQLDCPDTLAHLSRLGATIAPPTGRRICHWSTYMRAGALRFYGDLLRRTDQLPLTLLRRELPNGTLRRGSRLVAHPLWPAPLLSLQKTG